MNQMPTASEVRVLHRKKRLARFNANLRLDQTMTAPTVSNLIAPDNLVPSTAELSGLEVSIPEWDRIRPDDIVSLMWEGTKVDVSQTVADPDNQQFPITLKLPSDFLKTNGTHKLGYYVIATSGAEALSFTIDVKVDLDPPNQGNTPDALIFPTEVVNNGLTLEYLTANDGRVIATVPAYKMMEAGQTVYPVWGNLNLPSVVVTEEDVNAGQVSVAIQGDAVMAAGEGAIESHYRLTSRAGYDGLDSESSVVSVILTPVPANLKAPKVPFADDGLIDLPDADKGVTIEISEYSNAINGDSIIAKWGNTSLPVVSVTAGNFPIEIDVPRRTIMAEGSGSISVMYQVIRKDRTYDSPPIKVTVDVDHVGPDNPDDDNPVNEALLPPTIKGSTEETNALEPADAGKVAHVTVPFYDNAKLGEVITVSWGENSQAKLLTAHTVVQADLDNKSFPDFEVPADVVSATPNDPEWPVFYTLSRAVEPANPVRSPSQLVNVYLTGPSNLGQPVLPDVNDRGWLLLANVENGANVLVPVYENMESGDSVTIMWQAFSTTNAAAGTEIEDSAYTASKTVGAPELAAGVAFVIPYEGYIDAIAAASPYAQGSAQVKYTVSQSGHEFASEAIVVPVDLGIP